MKTILIYCNTKGEVIIDDNTRTNGMSIVLIDENGIPIARYEFDNNKVSSLTKLSYDANNVRIHFHGNIIPTMIFEITSAYGE